MVHLGSDNAPNPPGSRRRVQQFLQEIPAPFALFRWAATSIILPEVWSLQTVAVEVLPKILTDMTLDGPTESSISSPLPPPFDTVILLTMQSGLPLPREPTLWTSMETLLFGALEPRAIRILVVCFRKVRLSEAIMDPPSLLFAMSIMELAKLSCPTALQFIIIILLNTLPLLRNRMLTWSPPLIPTLPEWQLTQEITKARFRFVRMEQCLPRLAALLVPALPITMAVFISGLLLDLDRMTLETTPSRLHTETAF